MKLLLDTHVFLWLQTDPDRLGTHLATVADPANELLLSAASSWELAIKVALGKLELPVPVEQYVPSRAREIGATLVAIEHDHALRVAGLPPLHRDPFDRLLVAQAAALGATLLTADAAVAAYPGGIQLIDQG
ncbi:MAG: type II toxin-antitoxin system VapC family toxin [Solirubrobacteraceae bacterium]|nr:type II toxin-antitoxin system VapC family toxin [Patulibacter sp.]